MMKRGGQVVSTVARYTTDPEVVSSNPIGTRIIVNIQNGRFWVDSALNEYTGYLVGEKVSRQGRGLATRPH